MRNYLILLVGLIAGCSQSHDSNIAQQERPEENRFTRQIFLNNLDEPTELDILPDGRIIFTQRKGEIKIYDPESDVLVDYDSIPVYHDQEDGLLGMSLDPNFDLNRWIYLYYSPVGHEAKQNLSRFRFTEKGLTDEIVMLEVKTQREECCHTGGSIQFGGDDLLYLSTGDDTNPFASDGYGPMDERPGRSAWDAQRSSSNTNDLRGKILRIKPQPNGSYTIPEGNLFVDEDELTRPEIYVMGCRNPYRIGVDQKRGWLFWGEVGPDARESKPERGSRGYDEFNLAKKAGYYGWPLFVGPNLPYRDYDFATGESGPAFDPMKPVNNSPNNTGIKDLPPANPALVYYPYAESAEFPQLGTGGRNAMAGPVYYADDYAKSKGKFPSFFDGSAMYFDWIRGHIFFLKLSEEGTIEDWYRFMPNTTFSNPMDFEYGPDGCLYGLEYGTGWFTQNVDAKLTKISYISGNRPPVLQSNISSFSGKAPLSITFDASGSMDYDGDKLYYTWKIDEEEFKDPVVNYQFEKEGIYYPELIVRDVKGNRVREQYKVTVGNAKPELQIAIDGNQSFFWKGRKINYQVKVTDQEDGDLGAGIDPAKVKFDIQHYQSFDMAEALGHQTPQVSANNLMESLDCKSCHKPDAASIGPSFTQVANRYTKKGSDISYLINKVINGGGGVWGETAMSAHPGLSQKDAGVLVEYILSFKLGDKQPLKGTYVAGQSTGSYYFSSSYEDKGKGNIPPITATENIVLVSNIVNAIDYDESKGVKKSLSGGSHSSVSDIHHGSFIGFKQLDLTNIESILVGFDELGDGDIMVTTGKVDGTEIGKISVTENSAMKMSIKIDPVDKISDIYFIFSNPNSTYELFSIQYFEFIPKK